MRKEYDFSGSVKNPYTEKLKEQITVSVETETLRYFRNMAENMGVSYQYLIDLYLQDCARSGRKLSGDAFSAAIAG
jgi:hypothetical protein